MLLGTLLVIAFGAGRGSALKPPVSLRGLIPKAQIDTIKNWNYDSALPF